MSKSNGVVLWSGASLLTGEDIVVILTGLNKPTTNRKTGWMIQSWVIRKDIAPSEAAKQGKDQAICGNCPLKHKVCYVNLVGVNQVYGSYLDGKYPFINFEWLRLLKLRPLPLRITSYGDALATPLEIWLPLLKICRGHTGYTHQWQRPNIDLRWRNYLMASVETPELAARAQKEGWRTYRTGFDWETPHSNEIYCPNYQNSLITCEQCKRCDGAGNRPSIYNPVHGLDWKKTNFKTLRAKQPVS